MPFAFWKSVLNIFFRPKMWCRSIFNYRFVLGFSNLALSVGVLLEVILSAIRLFLTFPQACGVILLAYGIALYTDTNRILLSRLIGASSDKLSHLPHPFFYYIALGLAVAGLIAILSSFIGWWATCLNNHCILSIVCGTIFSFVFSLRDSRKLICLYLVF